jgi:PAS domain S-box-containing protein
MAKRKVIQIVGIIILIVLWSIDFAYSLSIYKQNLTFNAFLSNYFLSFSIFYRILASIAFLVILFIITRYLERNKVNSGLPKKLIEQRTKELEELNKILSDEIEQRKERENILSANEEKYRTLLEQIPVGVYRTTAEGKFIYANLTLAKILGFESVNELMEVSANDFYLRQEQRKHILDIHSKGLKKLIKAESILVRKDGKKIFVLDFGRRIEDTITKSIYFDGVIIDITEQVRNRKALELSERRFKNLFNRLTDLYIRLDTQDTILIVSPSIENILGYAPKEIIGKNIRNIITNPQWYSRTLEQLEELGKIRNALIEFKSADGSTKYLNGDFILFKDKNGKIIGSEALLRDITNELEHKNYMSAIVSVSKAFNDFDNIETIGFELVKAYNYLLNVPNFALFLLDQEDEILRCRFSFDHYGLSIEPVELKETSHPLIQSITSGKYMVFDSNAMAKYWKTYEAPIPQSSIVLPIIAREKTLGAINIYTYTRPEVFSNVNYYYITLLTEQIAIELERKILQDELNSQVMLMETLIESIPYPIYYFNLRTEKFSLCNTAFESFAEKPRNEIIGHTKDKVFPPELYETIKLADEQITSEGFQEFEIIKKDMDGNQKIFYSIRKLLKLFEPNEFAVVGIMLDVTERVNYEVKLQNASEFNRHILELTPNGIFSVDNDARITIWNKRAEEITGYKYEEVIGRKCFLCKQFGYNDCPIASNEVEPEILAKEVEITTKSGEKRIIYKNASILFDRQGNRIGVIESFDDITLRKNLENRLKFIADTNTRISTISNLATLIKDQESLYDVILPIVLNTTSSEGVAYLSFEDKSGKPVLTTIYHVTPKTKDKLYVEISIDNFHSPDLRKAILEKEIIEVEKFTEDTLEPQLGFLKNKHLVIATVFSANRTFGVLIVYGKKTPYATEEIDAVERISFVIATNVERITYETELNNALIKQYQLNEMRSNFIAMISHEYRTPLQAIILSAEILQKHLYKLTSEQKQIQFDRIRKAIQDMSNMIEHVTLYNRLTRAEESVNIEEVSAKSFFESIIKDYELYYHQKAKIIATLKTNKEKIKIDQRLVSLIFSNLITNAIKYSTVEPTVEIKVETDDQKTEISVKDNGIGIPANEIEKIFEPFYRGKNTKSTSGTGLGLSIVKHAVNLLKGQIFVDSEINKGTTFVVQIPTMN